MLELYLSESSHATQSDPVRFTQLATLDAHADQGRLKGSSGGHLIHPPQL